MVEWERKRERVGWRQKIVKLEGKGWSMADAFRIGETKDQSRVWKKDRMWPRKPGQIGGQ